MNIKNNNMEFLNEEKLMIIQSLKTQVKSFEKAQSQSKYYFKDEEYDKIIMKIESEIDFCKALINKIENE